MVRALRNMGILIVALIGFGAPVFAEGINVAALDILSDASTYASDAENVDTTEGVSDFASVGETSGDAELQINESQSISNNVMKVP